MQPDTHFNFNPALRGAADRECGGLCVDVGGKRKEDVEEGAWAACALSHTWERGRKKAGEKSEDTSGFRV